MAKSPAAGLYDQFLGERILAVPLLDKLLFLDARTAVTDAEGL